MSSTSALSSRSVLSLCSLALLAFALPARAAVTEPDGTVVPLDLTEDLNANCCGIEPDGSNMRLSALFTYRGEPIDWLQDASTEPSYFSPLCGFRGSLILRGGGCRITFGWYNVDLNDPTPPPDTEVYPLVTVADVNAWFLANGMEQNNDNAFHPAVGERPIEGAPVENIRDDPRYAGGLIGLATLGDDIGSPPQCTQTHYSEPRLNQMSAWGEPWVMALVYISHSVPNAFYIAFEDLPTAPDNFRLLTSRGYFNDGDFNDFVYFVEGITCEGGGQPCLTSAEGACGFGLTECLPDGTVVCVSQVRASAEVCDNLDNDCNGLVDDGDLCDPGEVCDKGVCRPNCSGGEFPCESPLVCDNDTGLCVDPDCLDVECAPGQVCMGGECIGGCTDVVCPQGQVCQLGRCVDPCANRTCSEGMVCEGGVCVQSCQCRVCAPGTECDFQSGQCVPTGCIGVTCPDGQRCEAGACVDACAGVVCPGGATCENGFCGEPVPGYVPPEEPGTGGAGPVLIGDGGVVSPGTGGGQAITYLCDDSCASANNGLCEDGSPGSVAETCAYGTDCTDCGQQLEIDAMCEDTCPTANNGVCEDGGGNSVAATCARGTDCNDCGKRFDGTPTDPGSLGGGSADLNPGGADQPGCGCRAVGTAPGRAALAGLLLTALGFAGLRRRRR